MLDMKLNYHTQHTHNTPAAGTNTNGGGFYLLILIPKLLENIKQLLRHGNAYAPCIFDKGNALIANVKHNGNGFEHMPVPDNVDINYIRQRNDQQHKNLFGYTFRPDLGGKPFFDGSVNNARYVIQDYQSY